MNAAFDRPSLWRRILPAFLGFDGPLALAVLLLSAAGLVAMYSAGYDHGTRFADHARNMVLAGGVLFVVAQLRQPLRRQLAVPAYVVGMALLISVALFGLGRDAAHAWLRHHRGAVGVRSTLDIERQFLAKPPRAR